MIKKFIQRISKISINLVVAFFSFSCIYPFVWMLNSSVKTSREFMEDSLGLATSLNLENYLKVFQVDGFPRYFFNSAYLAVLNVILTVICAFLLGYFLSRYHFRFRNLIYGLILAGMVIPNISLQIPIFIQFKTFGLLNKWYTMIMPYLAFSMPFSVIVVENYIKSIPRELDEAGYMEGCSTFQLLKNVIFPMCKPSLAIVVINAFISAWNEFTFAIVLLSDKSLYTLSIGIRTFSSEHTVDYPLFIAALLITIGPIMIIYAIFSKYILEGMTVGAVKG